MGGAGSRLLERSLELRVWQLYWREGKQFVGGSFSVCLLVWGVSLSRLRHLLESLQNPRNGLMCQNPFETLLLEPRNLFAMAEQASWQTV